MFDTWNSSSLVLSRLPIRDPYIPMKFRYREKFPETRWNMSEKG